MKKLFLSAGHSNVSGRDCGAVGNGYVEGVLAAELRQLIAAKLQNIHGITAIVDSDDSVLKQTLETFRAFVSHDSIAIEIHFNASANPLATGAESLVPSDPSELENNIAHALSYITAETLGIKDRGVKTELQSHHKKLGWMRQQGECVIWEVCFISNAHDIKNYQTYKSLLATNVADALAKFTI